MAASWCRTRLLNCSKNAAFVSRNGSLQRLFQHQDITSTVQNTHKVRWCSQFALKAEKMDGNYRLKDGTDKLNFTEEITSDTYYRPRERRKMRPLPHVEQQNMYYESRHYMVRRYQLEGEASGIDPSIMWPTKTELAKMKAFEDEWSPTLQEMQAELEEERRAFRLQELKRYALYFIALVCIFSFKA